MVVVKNGRGISLGHGTLKYVASQADFLDTNINLWRLKSTLMIIGLAWSKMGETF